MQSSADAAVAFVQLQYLKEPRSGNGERLVASAPSRRYIHSKLFTNLLRHLLDSLAFTLQLREQLQLRLRGSCDLVTGVEPARRDCRKNDLWYVSCDNSGPMPSCAGVVRCEPVLVLAFQLVTCPAFM